MNSQFVLQNANGFAKSVEKQMPCWPYKYC